jgi:16S rRNA processing protein RimM
MKLAIARIGRPHGVKGEVTIESLTDLPQERFVVGVALETDSSLFPLLSLSRVRVHQGIWMLTFNEIADRTSAERIRNTRLYCDVDIEEVSEDGEGESFHIEQLKGMAVVTESGELIGTVLGVQNLPGQDLLEVETPRGSRLIPMVHQFILEIDSEASRIVVDLPEGLVE